MTSVIARSTASGSAGAATPSSLNAPAMPHMGQKVEAGGRARTGRQSRVALQDEDAMAHGPAQRRGDLHGVVGGQYRQRAQPAALVARAQHEVARVGRD